MKNSPKKAENKIPSEAKRTIKTMAHGIIDFYDCAHSLPPLGVEVLVLLQRSGREQNPRSSMVALGMRLAQKNFDTGDTNWNVFRDESDQFRGNSPTFIRAWAPIPMVGLIHGDRFANQPANGKRE